MKITKLNSQDNADEKISHFKFTNWLVVCEFHFLDFFVLHVAQSHDQAETTAAPHEGLGNKSLVRSTVSICQQSNCNKTPLS
ncbi:hypothetical protein Patl1_21101 [Pistacia atlantica]|uniref:Uncharacterized protein n=1 Tax=Pistacia atlantica TaxID=434234 RepID=A0ACC1BLE3_9ROSI|nr:hypothetical protein Patl1_21101 [Pistacia atlantica]